MTDLNKQLLNEADAADKIAAYWSALIPTAEPGASPDPAAEATKAAACAAAFRKAAAQAADRPSQGRLSAAADWVGLHINISVLIAAVAAVFVTIAAADTPSLTLLLHNAVTAVGAVYIATALLGWLAYRTEKRRGLS
ncbi:hypothetical protein [Streptomyces sp. SM12]|uniref:hypothetical protein n=1 Tax=Streptomyces sp. SM12 TaxID=1071602 RepID=UPI0011B03213|nr:hypothetical protein [Streptomyces sp. SM12]